ncbi:hypothetical protein [Acinetobacter wuhouensis]|uniref:Lipoprotein n=1 Tax=Acinetobacter wuhouensis TaxID=1879050 RepID=A0A4Q7AMW5_9GAMM|nr:hypothetical protein [Acinetobacter wuhouensis]RZG45968.1 hypothetical protein EXU28_10800 [Acinetobacter wuhouensis]RZG72168.1 hypothetical protein EXU29_11080 [Acinetobacter wuhouensis]
MKIKSLVLILSLTLLTACQTISPIFVDYNGVRMDVAKWINQHQLLSMQQKRSMVQLSNAQQQLQRIDNISETQKLAIAKDNSIAMHCAQQHLTESQISQLQQQIFGDDKQRILEIYDQKFPKLKLDVNAIQCE